MLKDLTSFPVSTSPSDGKERPQLHRPRLYHHSSLLGQWRPRWLSTVQKNLKFWHKTAQYVLRLLLQPLLYLDIHSPLTQCHIHVRLTRYPYGVSFYIELLYLCDYYYVKQRNY